MQLSISGLRAKVGGVEGLTPYAMVSYGSAYAEWALGGAKAGRPILLGRDARTTGDMVATMIASVLRAMGCAVLDLGLSTTPTVGFNVRKQNAAGGIMVSASHNPAEWNALKFFNADGEFLSPNEVASIGKRARGNTPFSYATHTEIGTYTALEDGLETHIAAITQLDLVDTARIKARHPRIAIHGMNSTGGIAVPRLLKQLGVSHIKTFYGEPNGLFPHNPEPLPEHIAPFCEAVEKGHYDLGIVVDPDVDRLVLVDEKGEPFGEEYTLVAVADYVLQHEKGAVVSNLSSSIALDEVAMAYGQRRYRSAIGEYHVVALMKEKKAVIGGEGNGGVIYPRLHAGRDALTGIALFLSHWTQSQRTVSTLRARYPKYELIKKRYPCPSKELLEPLFQTIKAHCKPNEVSEIDGLWMGDQHAWLHVRPSNTEPILRIYYETKNKSVAWIHTAIQLIEAHLVAHNK